MAHSTLPELTTKLKEHELSVTPMGVGFESDPAEMPTTNNYETASR